MSLQLQDPEAFPIEHRPDKLHQKEQSVDEDLSRELDLDTLLTQVKFLVSHADDASRTKTLEKLRSLSYSMEAPDDTAKRVLYNNMQLAAIRIGIDLNLFKILSKAGRPLTNVSLAESTGAAPELLGRLLRYLASVAIIKETDAHLYTATNITDTLAMPGYEAGGRLLHDMEGPVYQTLPAFFKEHGYKDVTNISKTPLAYAWGTDQPMFQWLQTKPDILKDFNALMKRLGPGRHSWLDVYPLEYTSQDLLPDQPLFLDVGGGLGHQAMRLAEQFPNLGGRVIVQDIQPSTVALKHEKVEFMHYDFFTPQLIKGAKIYYLRNCIHNWPSEKVVLILQNLKAAMAPNSVILIDEMVIPKTGAHFHTTQMDMIMMMNFAAVERTEGEFRALIEEAGLWMNNVYIYDESARHAVVEAVLPRRGRRGSHL